MIVAITIIAVADGEFAFKAKKYGLARICTGTKPNECFNIAFESTTTERGDRCYYYTTTDASDCRGVTECPTCTYLTGE